MRGKKRLPEERVLGVSGPLPPCRVCGEEAAGFHYGANTCEACKGFFRRSLLRNGDYDCIQSENCTIGPNRRKSCPKCRYLKCLSVGMSKEAIKTGRYTYTKRTQDTLEINMLKKQKLQLESNQPTTENKQMFQDESDMVTENIQKLKLQSHLITESKQKLQFESDLNTERDYASNILIGSTMCSFEQRSFHENMNDCDSVVSNSYCSVSSTDMPDKSRSIVGSVSSSASTPSSLSEITAFSANVSPPSPCSSQTDIPEFQTIKLKSSKEFSERDSKEFLEKGYKEFPERCSKQFQERGCKEFREQSTVSASWTCDFRHREFQNEQSLSQTNDDVPLESAEMEFPHNPSQLKSLSESGDVPEASNWHVFSDTELDEFISVIVSAHKLHVQDVNSVSAADLQEMFKACRERCNLQTEIFGHLGTIQKDEHDRIYESTGLDVDGRLDNLSYAAQKMDVYVRQMIAFMKLIPGFRSLKLSDQTALVKASMNDLLILGFYRGYNKEERMVVEPMRSYCRHQMFCVEEGMDIIFDIAQQLQDLQLSFKMVAVLKAVCILFTDRAILEDASAVEQLQFKVVQSLLLLLRRRNSHQENRLFARIMSVLALTRDHAEYCHKFILTHMMSGSYVERFYNVPIMMEFLHAHINN